MSASSPAGVAGNPSLRQRLTTACVILLVAGVSLDHKPIPAQADTVAALLGTALAAGLAVRSAPRTRILYLAGALFGVAIAITSLPIHRTYPVLGMGRAFYLPALVLVVIAGLLAWPELRDSLSQDREKRRTAAVEANRAHTSRELHDETLQGLIHLRRSLERAGLNPDPDAVRAAVDDSAGLAAEQISALRDIIADIHPTILTDLGLPAALEALVDRAARHQPQITLTFQDHLAAGELPPVDAATGLAAYRIIQEALTNAIKHSGASTISIVLTQHRRDLLLEITDNGTGLQPGTNRSDSGGLGIPAMRARAELHNGRLTVTGAPGEGTTVTALLHTR